MRFGTHGAAIVLAFAALATRSALATPPEPQVEAAKNEAQRAADKMQYGDALYRLEDLTGACKAFKEAIDILPSWWLPHVAYVRCGRFIGAPVSELLLHAEQAVKARPELPLTHLQYGLILEDAGRTAEAVREYEVVLAAQPRTLEARYRLGVVLEQRGEVARARVALEAVVAQSEGHVMARSLLADLCEETKDIAGARTHLEALLRTSRYPQLALSRLIRFLERNDLARDAAALRAQYARQYR